MVVSAPPIRRRTTGVGNGTFAGHTKPLADKPRQWDRHFIRYPIPDTRVYAFAHESRVNFRPFVARCSALGNIERQIFVAPASSGRAWPKASITHQLS